VRRDVSVHVPSEDTPLIQQLHITLGHTLCAIAEDAIASNAGADAAPPLSPSAPQREPTSSA
jgi:hypothetical protein